MQKKRILATTMMSVVALSGAASSVVAQAAVADYKDQLTMTKAELKAFLEDKEIVDLVENDGIDNFGSISGDNFMKAYEYANAVVNDSDSTDDDATTAFLMVKAAKASLIQYDKKELSALVEQCRPIYDTDNILNDNEDAIYTGNDWDEFCDAFEEADGYTDYDDIRITTDAYEKLDAVKDPDKMDTKTKSQINRARQDYEKALAMEFDFEPWQRGTVEGTGTKYDGYQFAWGALYANIKSGNEFVTTQYNEFDSIKGLTVTSNESIVRAVDDMETAYKVLKGFKANFESGNKSKTNKLISTYYGQLVYKYNTSAAQTIAADFQDKAGDGFEFVTDGKWMAKGKTGFVTIASTSDAASYWNLEMSESTKYKPLGNKDTTDGGISKVLSAELSVRAGKDLYYYVDTDVEMINGANPLVTCGAGAYFSATRLSTTGNKKAMTLKSKTTLNLSELIPVTATMISTGLKGEITTDIQKKSETIATNAGKLYTYDASTPSGAIVAIKDITSALEAYTDAATSGLVSGTPVTTALNAVPSTSSAASIVAAVTAAIADVKAAATGLDGAMDSVISAVSGLTSVGYITGLESSAGVDGAVSNLTSTGTGGAFSDYNTAITALKDAVDAVSTAVKNYNDATTTAASKLTLLPMPSTIGDDTSKYADMFKITTDDKKVTLDSLVEDLKALKPLFDQDNSFDPNETDRSAWNSVYDKCGEDSKIKDDNGLWDPNYGFVFDAGTYGYQSTKSEDPCDDTTVSLYKAMTLFEGFVKAKPDWVDIKEIDNNNTVVEPDNEKKISAAAWKLLYNYMKYALEDNFMASSAKSYTKKDVQDLYNKSLSLADATVETEMFNYSHMNLYNWRNAANEWLKQARADKSAYKDNDTTYNVSVSGASLSNADSTAIYEKLESAYKQLKTESDGFLYSYGDISDDIAKIAKEVEAGKFGADATKKLTEDLDAVADAFIKVELLQNTSGEEYDESAVFNDDGMLNVHNRLLTSDGLDLKIDANDTFKVAKAKKDSNPNHSHWVMKEAYEKLLNDYKEITEAPVSQVTTDVDGNGKFELADVTTMLNLYVNGKGEVAKHDFNGDGKVSVDDVSNLLNQFVNKKD